MKPLLMTFGKYEGEALEDIPASYMLWVHENIDRLAAHIREWIEDNLDELKVAAADERKFRRWNKVR